MHLLLKRAVEAKTYWNLSCVLMWTERHQAKMLVGYTSHEQRKKVFFTFQFIGSSRIAIPPLSNLVNNLDRDLITERSILMKYPRAELYILRRR